MVIHHFNRVISNKWAWGTFAVIICICFAFSDTIVGRGEDDAGMVSKLGEDKIKYPEFNNMLNRVEAAFNSDQAARELVSGAVSAIYGREYKEMEKRERPAFVRKVTWEVLAALATARKNGLEATDSMISEFIAADQRFHVNGVFNQKQYLDMLKRMNRTPGAFEESVREGLTLQTVLSSAVSVSSGLSPLEARRIADDSTDSFTLGWAVVTNSDNVATTDSDLLEYYNSHTNKYVLPDRRSVKYIAVKASDPASYTNIEISTEVLVKAYNASGSRFETEVKGTNGTHKVKKPFDDVKAVLLKEAQVESYLNTVAMDLRNAIYTANTNTVSLVDEIGKKYAVEPRTSPFFSRTGRYALGGLCANVHSFASGATALPETAFKLDPSMPGYRYGFVTAKGKAVYLFELDKKEAGRQASFEEVKKVLGNPALDAKKAKILSEKASKVAEAARKAVAGGAAFDAKLFPGATVTNGVAFSASVEQDLNIPGDVAEAAVKLSSGEVSDFIPSSFEPGNSGYIVYVSSRVAGDKAKVSQLLDNVMAAAGRRTALSTIRAWLAWNLEDMGLQAAKWGEIKKSPAKK